MDVTRRPVGSLVEWLCAAICATGAVVLTSVAVHEFRSVRPVMPVIAEEVPESLPSADIPSGAARVPLLLLPNKREVRLGETLASVAERLGTAAQLVSESFDETVAGRRITRFYNDVGVQFVVVFDAPRQGLEPRVSAIFIR
jgi:hypothetical protein